MKTSGAARNPPSTAASPAPAAFSFGAAGTKPASTFSFGSTSPAAKPAAAESAAPPLSQSEKTAVGDESKADDSVDTSAATSAFDSVDAGGSGELPLSKFEEVLEVLGEGFHGDDLDEQRALADPEGTGKLTRSGFMRWYASFVAAEDDEDELDEEEVAEERQNALDAFEGLDTEDCGSLGKERCEDLFSALGTTYCEEKHARHMNKLCAKDGRVHKDEFVSWYIEWVFADNEDDEDDDEDESSKSRATAAPSSGFGDLGKLQAGEWKCPACSIKNVAASAKCVACETPNPNAPATAAPAAAAATATMAAITRACTTIGPHATDHRAIEGRELNRVIGDTGAVAIDAIA